MSSRQVSAQVPGIRTEPSKQYVEQVPSEVVIVAYTRRPDIKCVYLVVIVADRFRRSRR